jgi:hypothetical protein
MDGYLLAFLFEIIFFAGIDESPTQLAQITNGLYMLDPRQQACLLRITEDIQQASRITRPDFSDTARIIRF